MRIFEFNLSDLFRAATGDWPGDAKVAKELATMCTKATPGDILAMVKQAKKLKQRGQEVDLRQLCGNKLDPQIVRKMELQQKFTPDQVAKNRADRDLIKRKLKNQKRQRKRQKVQSTQTATSQPQVPPQNAKLPTKTFGDLVWNGREWLGPGGLKFTKPNDVKKIHDLYFKTQNATDNLETAKRDAENEKLKLQAYQKVFGMNRK